MSSNAYIASDGMNRMKVGKTNDPKRREKQIALPITMTIQCLDEAAALRVETQMREFVIQRGGIRHQQAIDWFIIDPQIYEMLCQFASGLIGQGANLKSVVETEANIDREIAALQRRYYELLLAEIERIRKEHAAESERLRQEFGEREDRYREDIQTKDKRIEELSREVGKWQAMYEILKERFEDEDNHQ